MRSANEHVLLLDAGDSIYGAVTPASSTKGASSIAVMNLLAYDALALGAGDFFIGQEIETRIAEARFPILSANTYLSSTGELPAAPYVLREIAGHTVAIVGVSESFTHGGYRSTDPVTAAAQAVQEVSAKATVIILLSHAGKPVDAQIAQQVPGIDVLIGGGLDLTLSPTQDPTFGAILIQAEAPQPGYAGLFLGQGTFHFDARGTVTQFKWVRHTITENVPADPEIAQWVSANP